MAAKSAAEAVGSAVEGVARRAPFTLGKKQVYLPNHIVTFLRPKPGQSPTTATFQVPLTFNKLDFRDYLYNVYNVEVNSVRAFINQKRPQQRSLPGSSGGQWYRPRSQKLMVVDLKKPFVWPERPSEDDMEPWDHKLFSAVEEGHDQEISEAETRVRGTPKLRTQMEADMNRVKLKDVAEQLLSGKKKWMPGTEWVETETEKSVAEAVAAPMEKEETQEMAGEKAEAEAKTVAEAVAEAEAEAATLTETTDAKENEKKS